MAATDENLPVEDDGRDLAVWLKEAGRRRPAPRAPGPEPKPQPRGRSIAWQTTILACLVAAYLQYYYLTVMLEIAELPTVVVFAVPR